MSTTSFSSESEIYMHKLIDKYGSFDAIPLNRVLHLKNTSVSKSLQQFDPAGRLLDVADKVKSIEGNANLEDARVVLLADHCHLDEDHKLWRGQIGTRVKSISNMILCEGIDSKRWNISYLEKQAALGVGFELGPADDVMGWDDNDLHQHSLQQIQSILTMDLTINNIINAVAGTSLRQKINDDRTDNLVKCIEQRVSLANGSRIIVDGGAAHLLDQRLLTYLSNHGIKYCAISAKLGSKRSQMTFKDIKEFYVPS